MRRSRTETRSFHLPLLGRGPTERVSLQTRALAGPRQLWVLSGREGGLLLRGKGGCGRAAGPVSCSLPVPCLTKTTSCLPRGLGLPLLGKGQVDHQGPAILIGPGVPEAGLPVCPRQKQGRLHLGAQVRFPSMASSAFSFGTAGIPRGPGLRGCACRPARALGRP